MRSRSLRLGLVGAMIEQEEDLQAYWADRRGFGEVGASVAWTTQHYRLSETNGLDQLYGLYIQSLSTLYKFPRHILQSAQNDIRTDTVVCP